MNTKAPNPDALDEVLLELHHVGVHYDDTCALDNVNLVVRARDFLAVIGPNGGGKTTLLKVILGLITPDEGSVTVLGTTPRLARRRLGYIPQRSRFDPSFPVRVLDVALMGRLNQSARLGRYSAQDYDRAHRALREVRMAHLSNRSIGTLSGGQQQRAMVARALVSDPELLLLDEPMASVDTAMQEEFYDLLSKLNRRMAIILVTHDLSAISVHVKQLACLNCRLYYHPTNEVTTEALESTYQCPVQLIAHGFPHRVLREHL
jgi:zinc transport system ATP-binding protein